MQLYVKKPVPIEAIELKRENWKELTEWSNGDVFGLHPGHDTGEPCVCRVQTDRGIVYANEGDMIIKGVQGEFYPCSRKVFDETYEPVKED